MIKKEDAGKLLKEVLDSYSYLKMGNRNKKQISLIRKTYQELFGKPGGRLPILVQFHRVARKLDIFSRTKVPQILYSNYEKAMESSSVGDLFKNELEETMPKEIISECSAFGKGWLLSAPECKACEKEFPDEYVACKDMTLQGKEEKKKEAKEAGKGKTTKAGFPKQFFKKGSLLAKYYTVMSSEEGLRGLSSLEITERIWEQVKVEGIDLTDALMVEKEKANIRKSIGVWNVHLKKGVWSARTLPFKIEVLKESKPYKYRLIKND